MHTRPRRAYVASKMGLMEPAVKNLILFLKSIGIEIIYDWTEKPVPKPFANNKKAAHEAAENMAKAVMECDILIVLFAEKGIGFHIETGGALVSGIISSFITGRAQKEIYVIGEVEDRSIFYYHDSVQLFPHIQAFKNSMQNNERLIHT